MIYSLKHESSKKESGKTPATERMEYRNAVWLLENETEGSYADFGKKIGKSRQEVNRILRKDPAYGISRQMSMRIERAFEKPSGWLSRDHGFPAPRQDGAEEAHEPRTVYTQQDLGELIGYSNAEYNNPDIAERREQLSHLYALRVSKLLNAQCGTKGITIEPVRLRDEIPLVRALAELTAVFRLSYKDKQWLCLIEKIQIPTLGTGSLEDTVTEIMETVRTTSLAEVSGITRQDGWLSIFHVETEDKRNFVFVVDEHPMALELMIIANEFYMEELSEVREILVKRTRKVFEPA